MKTLTKKELQILHQKLQEYASREYNADLPVWDGNRGEEDYDYGAEDGKTALARELLEEFF